MIIDRVELSEELNELFFSILGIRYGITCWDSKIVVDNLDTKTRISASHRHLLRRYRMSSKKYNCLVSAHTFTVHLLNLLKSFNLGEKVEFDEETSDMFLAFLSVILDNCVKLEYSIHIDDTELPKEEFRKYEVLFNDLECINGYNLMFTSNLSFIVENCSTGKYHNLILDEVIETYLILRYGLGDTDLDEVPNFKKTITSFIKNCIAYNS